MIGWLPLNRKKRKERKRVVLVTGASTGLGLALVKELSQSGKFHIIAKARASSVDRFAAAGVIARDDLWIRPLNVLLKTERDSVIEEANQKLGGIDVLINNAGYCLRGVVEQVNETERLKQIDTNFRAPMAMAPFIAKMMKLSPSTPEKIARKIIKIINSKNPPLRVPVTIDAYFFGLIRKLLPRKLYHTIMYYSLPRVFRWGEDDHYFMDAEYEQREATRELPNPKLTLPAPPSIREPYQMEWSGQI